MKLSRDCEGLQLRLVDEIVRLLREIDELYVLDASPLRGLAAIDDRPGVVRGSLPEAKALQRYLVRLTGNAIALLKASGGRERNREAEVLKLRLHNAFSKQGPRRMSHLARQWGVTRQTVYTLERNAVLCMVRLLPPDARKILEASPRIA